MTKLDAWVLARLMGGLSTNGKIPDVSPKWQEIAGRLNGSRRDNRAAVFEDYFKGRADEESVILAIADADPTAPPPID